MASRIPGEEVIALLNHELSAYKLAVDGQDLQGYEHLQDCLEQAMSVAKGQPWEQELMGRYHDALRRFADSRGLKPRHRKPAED